MKFTEQKIGGLRKVGSTPGRPGYVDVIPIPRAGPGDADLSQMRVWTAVKGGHSYVINIDGLHPGLGYRATVKALGGRKARREAEVLADGVATYEEAEAACLKHARSKMT